MYFIFSLLAAATGVYSILILIRIVISWFGGTVTGKPVDLLTRITDPYLDWWRRVLNLRLGFLDLSPIVAVAVLSLFQRILYSLAGFDRVTVGNILSTVLLSIWSVVSFLLCFCIFVIILRIIAFLTNRNIYSPFWRAIDTISQPVLYRINRIFFGMRIPGFLKGAFVSLIALFALFIVGGFIIPPLARLLSKLPF